MIEAKIGTLYNGLQIEKNSAMSYSIVFLVRRSIFIVITFALFNQPGLQIHLMIFLTIIYIMYLGYSDFHLSKQGKALEMTNETILVLIQYNFVLIHELISDNEVRYQVGNMIIGLTSILLAINLFVIIAVSFRPSVRKCYLTCVKNKKIRK